MSEFIKENYLVNRIKMHKKLLLPIASLVAGFFSNLIFFGFGGYFFFVLDWYGVVNKLFNVVVLLLMFVVFVSFIHLADKMSKKI